MTNSLLQINHLTKRYGSLTAISNVSFTVRRGEILGLIGPNGSGKTTLFECLGGVQAADAGSLLHDGKSLGERERSELLFYLPDGISPWPSQTVRWALDFTLGLFGGRSEIRDEVIGDMDIAGLMERSIGVLSKGQRKRALLAIGLLTPHPLLVADEPFEGLDLKQTRDVTRALRKYAEARTMLLSIHQIADAARTCDRFALLSGGRICGEGTLEELSATVALRGESVASPSLEEVFLALT